MPKTRRVRIVGGTLLIRAAGGGGGGDGNGNGNGDGGDGGNGNGNGNGGNGNGNGNGNGHGPDPVKPPPPGLWPELTAENPIRRLDPDHNVPGGAVWPALPAGAKGKWAVLVTVKDHSRVICIDADAKWPAGEEETA